MNGCLGGETDRLLQRGQGPRGTERSLGTRCGPSAQRLWLVLPWPRALETRLLSGRTCSLDRGSAVLWLLGGFNEIPVPNEAGNEAEIVTGAPCGRVTGGCGSEGHGAGGCEQVR